MFLNVNLYKKINCLHHLTAKNNAFNSENVANNT